MFLESSYTHCAILIYQWHLPFLVHSVQCVFPILHILFIKTLQNPTLFDASSLFHLKTCSDYRTPLAMANLSNVSSKSSKSISSWQLLFSVNLTPHNALFIAHSVSLKITILCFFRTPCLAPIQHRHPHTTLTNSFFIFNESHSPHS